MIMIAIVHSIYQSVHAPALDAERYCIWLSINQLISIMTMDISAIYKKTS